MAPLTRARSSALGSWAAVGPADSHRFRRSHRAAAGPSNGSGNGVPAGDQDPPGPSAGPPQRGRLTLEQMQREARAKLADLAAQQLAAQQQERLQQQRQQLQQGQARGSPPAPHGPASAEPEASSGTGGSPPSMQAARQGHGSTGVQAAPVPDAKSGTRTDVGTGSGSSAASVGSAAERAPAGTVLPNGGGEGAAAAAAGASGPPRQGQGVDLSAEVDREWEAMLQEWRQDWERIQARWRRFLERPLDPPRPPLPQQRQRRRQQEGQPLAAGPATAPAAAASAASAATATAAAARAAGDVGRRGAAPLEVVVPQVIGPDGPAAPAPDQTLGSGPSTDGASGPAAAGAQREESPAKPSTAAEKETQRRTGTTRLLQVALAAVFASQWAPVAQSLQAGASVPARELALAVLLACPPTPITFEWQADAVAVAGGHISSLFTSALLHSGLLSLLPSLASLDESGSWLETFHGPLIMLITFFMSGAGAALAQMCVAGQPAGIGGIGAALGMEAAVAVRVFRFSGTLDPLTPALVLLCAVGALMAFYQPLVGLWGVLGGLLGGALSGVLAYDVLWLMRVALGVSILLGVATWRVATWLPRAAWRVLVAACTLAWGALVALVQAVRGV